MFASSASPERMLHTVRERRWPSFDAWSVYGDAQKADLDWFGALLRASQQGPRDDHPCLLAGDFNWRNAYAKELPAEWQYTDRVRSHQMYVS